MKNIAITQIPSGRLLSRSAMVLLLMICGWIPDSVTGQVSRQWVATHNGTGDFNDHFNCITSDASGNSYLGGFTVSPDNERDYLVVKLDAAGARLWSKVFAGTSQGRDEANAIKVDASGFVYVTGFMNQNITGTDFFTVKLNPNGDTVWTATYNNNAAFGYDQANDLDVDTAGNVFVTGFSDSDPTAAINEDYLTIRYSSAGTQLWLQRFAGTGNAIDKAVRILIDPAMQNVYITGRSDNGANDDYVTIKYDYNGTQQWRVSGNRGGRDRAVDMAMDAGGNVYVTGRSSNGSDDDYWTIKYTTAGTVAWQTTYDFVENDRPSAIALDASGNVYVTGQSDGDATAVTNNDFLTVKYTAAGGQVWAARYDSPILQSDIAMDVAVSAAGAVYVTGISDNDASATVANTIVTIAYNAATGSQSWQQVFNRGTNLNVEATALCNRGSDCCVAGFVQSSSPASNALVLDYGATGSPTWNYSFDGIGNNNENVHSICVDNSNNVYACGYVVESDADRNMAMFKFNATGNYVCGKSVDGTSSGSTDDANGIVLDAGNNPFVAGFVDNTQNSNDIAYFKSDRNTCDTLYFQTYDGIASGSDKIYDLVRDAAGNFYVTGRVDLDPTYVSNQDCFTAKIGTAGNFMWRMTYNRTAANEDRGSFIRLGVNGEVYVVGRTFNGTNYDILLLGYSNAGVLVWSQVYDGGANDFATGLVIDNRNNLFLCGRKETTVPGVFDYLTMKYNSVGLQQWASTYDGTGNGDDEAQALAFSQYYRGPIVTGKSDSDPSVNIDFDMKTLQYDSTGAVQWTHAFQGLAGADDIPDDISINASNQVLMTGHTNKSTLLSPNYDIRTVMLNPLTGAEEWSDVYNGPSDSSDIGNQLFVYGSDFYVAGSTYHSVTQRDALIIKYAIAGNGIAESSLPATLISYPSPAGSILYIKGTAIFSHGFKLSVFDAAGRMVTEQHFTGGNEVAVALTGYAEGVYTFLISALEGVQYRGKFIHINQ